MKYDQVSENRQKYRKPTRAYVNNTAELGLQQFLNVEYNQYYAISLSFSSLLKLSFLFVLNYNRKYRIIFNHTVSVI